MHIHILGIGGTFMAGIAVIAKQQGYQVTGSDQAVYPPMSTQLREQGIELHEGYEIDQFTIKPDLVIIGNAMKRGIPAVEYVLSQSIPFISAPQWLYEFVLKNKHVIAVAGTHGKTTTTSLITWILESAGLNPSFLIGGIPSNFNTSSRLTDSKYFVIEADEYDSVFYDKRPKFMHFFPKTCVINNIEFDHADIYDNVAAIKKQFGYLLRTVAEDGCVIANAADQNVMDVIKHGIYSPLQTFYGDWQAVNSNPDCSSFDIQYDDEGKKFATIQWQLLGAHNQSNALAAVAAAHRIGIEAEKIAAALNSFNGVKRRLEVVGKVNDITIYDDFAHHPTAIATTINGLKNKISNGRIIVVMECASYTMRAGVHRDTLPQAFNQADQVFFLKPDWDYQALEKNISVPLEILPDVPTIIQQVRQIAKPQDHILIMSNRGFGGIHQKLLTVLQTNG